MPIIRLIDIESGEIVEREMNLEELAQYEKDQAEALAKRQAEIESAEKRQALLDRLGITEEEAQLLLS